MITCYRLTRLLALHHYFIDARHDSLTNYRMSDALLDHLLPSVEPIYRCEVAHYFTSVEQLSGPDSNYHKTEFKEYLLLISARV